MLLLSSDLWCCRPKPWDFGLALTSVDARRCCRRRGRRRPRIPLLNGNYNGKVIPLSNLVVCYVWLLQMVIGCVFLRNVMIGCRW
jgi:hypothetical protein